MAPPCCNRRPGWGWTRSTALLIEFPQASTHQHPRMFGAARCCRMITRMAHSLTNFLSRSKRWDAQSDGSILCLPCAGVPRRDTLAPAPPKESNPLFGPISDGHVACRRAEYVHQGRRPDQVKECDDRGRARISAWLNTSELWDVRRKARRCAIGRSARKVSSS